eukprot:7004528-Pyramimonas_sp.AAC.1
MLASTVAICAQSVAAVRGRRGATQPRRPTEPPPNAACEQCPARLGPFWAFGGVPPMGPPNV